MSNRQGDERLTRRASLVRLGGFFAAAVAAGGWRAGLGKSAGAAEVRCVLTPEMTEGPFYIPGEKVRRNITEGRKGTPLALRLRVVDSRTCRPVKRAAVDVWHADAGGLYSGEGALGTSGQIFMRGVQRTDARGLAVFQTIYPGWYTGRAVHIHVKVHVGGNVVHTGQLFFSDSLTDSVYRSAPYRVRPDRDTRNAADSIFLGGGRRSLLSMRKKRGGGGYVGSITMGVRRT